MGCGIDFPFGQPRKFVTDRGWPESWEGDVQKVSQMKKEELGEFDSQDNLCRNPVVSNSLDRKGRDLTLDRFCDFQFHSFGRLGGENFTHEDRRVWRER